MKVQFFGAAQTVTGSCYMFEAAGMRFAVDCGMHQGASNLEKRNFDTKSYRASDIDFFLMTHAHIDHSGLLPRMVAEGFKGKIYCTPPTSDLMEIMLLDSAHIQEMETEWKSKKKAISGINFNGLRPLYNEDDVKKTVKLFSAVQYEQKFNPKDNPNITVCYRDAGHILGAAFLELDITENGKSSRLVFSGDLGRKNSLLVHDPEIPNGKVDYLFVESTYGDRNHKNEDKSLDELAEAIAYSYHAGGKVVIPVFAVERTQEIIYSLYLLRKQGRLPEDIPVFVDSPLATRATAIFNKYKSYLDDNTQKLLQAGENPLDLPNLRFTQTVKESQAINENNNPAIVLSASGMCNAGRIKHHLQHNIWRPESSVVFVGYQGFGTPGRKIVDGAESIRLFNSDIAVKAKIFTIGGFSAHAGQSQIMEWIDSFDNKDMKVILIHGEEKAQTILSKLIKDTFKLPVTIPDFMEELIIEPDAPIAVKCCPPDQTLHAPDWDLLLADSELRLEKIRERMPKIAERPVVEQLDLYDRLLEIKNELSNYLRQL